MVFGQKGGPTQLTTAANPSAFLFGQAIGYQALQIGLQDFRLKKASFLFLGL